MKSTSKIRKCKFLIFLCGCLFCLGACNNQPVNSEESSFSYSSDSSSQSDSSSSEPPVVIDEQINLSELSVGCGGFNAEPNKLVTTVNDTIAYSLSHNLGDGTIEVDMKNNNPANDNGVIFSLSTSINLFWENNVSYYFFFISRNYSSYLGKVDQGQWSCLSDVPLTPEQIVTDYQLKIIEYDLTDYKLIECYVGGVLMNKCRDYSPLTGKGIGLRAGSSRTEYQNFNIKSETGPKETDMENYYLANGEFIIENNRYVSTLTNSIIVHRTATLEYGTISTSLKASEVGDNGIIFALDDGGNKSFWEHDVSYYFFFVSISGTAYLGKVSNNSWKELGVVRIPLYNITKEYALKVTRDETSILCYVDDELLLYCVDDTPLSGNKIGLRAGSKGTSFAELIVEQSGSFDYHNPEGFDITSGEMVQFQNTIKSTQTNSLIVSQEGKREGTFKTKMYPGSMTNNGIIFNLTAPSGASKYYEREEGLSYYFFHISTNSSARLLKFDGENAQVLSEFGLSAGWSGARESLLTVIVNGNNIKCYVDDACYVNYTDSSFLPGSLYGLRASAKGVLFSDFEASNNSEAKHADIVLFGHSHCQFYETFHQDLSCLGTLANMGVGGSIIANWENRINHITSYNAKYIMVWLGSNDLATGMTASQVVEKLEALVEAIHLAAPSSKIIVFTEFYQPESYRATDTYRAYVRNLNESILNRFPDYTIGLDLFDIPMKDGVLDLDMFRDVYHLKPEAYQGITERIIALINSLENQ